MTDSLAAFGRATDRCLIMVDAAGENMIVSLIDAARSFRSCRRRPGSWSPSRRAIGC